MDRADPPCADDAGRRLDRAEGADHGDLQIDTESLRYSADCHGQALAYKLGAGKFHELRDRAAKALGPKFDLPAFHAYVLQAGAMPLTVLEGHVACFIRERHAARIE